jgi:protein-S-isoprenylcysteine O-methyltransferase Ste14
VPVWLVACGTPLLLGSGYGILFGLLLVVVHAVRAVLEEHTLRDSLQGCADPMSRVKYRLIPYVWQLSPASF